jgi:energy-coupling factor transporter ATP-binding protein EcfA2
MSLKTPPNWKILRHMLQIENLKNLFVGPVDLGIAAGECVAIRGASGSGKSLLLRAIADLDPNDGNVTWNGQSRSALPAPKWRQLVGLVPAESGWWANRVVEHFETKSELNVLLDAVGLPPDHGTSRFVVMSRDKFDELVERSDPRIARATSDIPEGEAAALTKVLQGVLDG